MATCRPAPTPAQPMLTELSESAGAGPSPPAGDWGVWSTPARTDGGDSLYWTHGGTTGPETLRRQVAPRR